MRAAIALLIASTGLGSLASALVPEPSSPPNQQVRLSWQEFSKDPQRVASFARGVEEMKKKNGANPSSTAYRGSWEYWASMHSYYGPQSSSGTIADGLAALKGAGLAHLADRFKGIANLMPPDAIAKEVWDGCRHSFVDQNNQLVAQNFFGWHRLYLYYFERVLRAAAQDDTLRLPYWDYTSGTQGQLPSGFGSIKGKPLNAALFEPRRASGLNDGTQIISPLRTNIDTILANQTFDGLSGFSAGIEFGVHGTIHCAVGAGCPAPYMGAVAVSANDPVFWLHHTNIDRLFQCWMQKHNKKPGGSFPTDSFVFVDETGARVQRTVADFLEADKLEYRYDNVANCARPASGPELTANMPGQPAPPQTTTLAEVKGISLAKSSTTITLPLPASGAAAGPQATVANAEALDLVLSDIAAEGSPGAMFDVYIGRPGAPPAQRVYVGTLNFFGAGEGAHGKHPRTRAFDVTTQAKTLAAKAGTGANLELTFEATTGLDAAPGTAGGSPAVELTKTTTIGRVELRARPRNQQ